MRYFVLLFLVVSSGLWGEDFKTPHKFKQGEIISSDQTNELFKNIETRTRNITVNDLIGSWNCTKYLIGGTSIDEMRLNYTQVNGLYFKSDNFNLTFTDNNDGTYSWSSEVFNAFFYASVAGGDKYNGIGGFDLLGDNLAVNGSNYTINLGPSHYLIKRISNTRLELKRILGGTTIFLICDKKYLTPDQPTSLTKSTNTTTPFNIDLAWIDNSTDESGFMITRKTTLSGEYIAITTAASNAVTYTDTVTQAGDYWYRIHATSDVGNSIGSNVAKVTVHYPVTPVIFQAVALSKTVTLSWSNEASLISGLTGYKVLRKKVQDKNFVFNFSWLSKSIKPEN